MEDEQRRHLRAGMESLLNSVNTVFLATGDSKDEKQNLDQLKKCLKDVITAENRAIKSNHAMARIQGLLNDSLLKGRGLENLEKIFEKALKEEKEPILNVEKHVMMSKFESRVAKLTQNAMDRNKSIGGDENDGSSASECEESDTENEK
jgi:hypothetical protein